MTDEQLNKFIGDRFKDESGDPIKLFPGQIEIFKTIAGRTHPRTQTICYTRYGKSFTVALALDIRASTYPEKWAVVAPSNKQANIIMGYCIDHIFDNEYTASKFDIGSESRERIRRERSKQRITFRLDKGLLGEIFILSTEGRRVKDVLGALMGFGAPNIVFDESSLVSDNQYSGVKRMVGDLVKKSKEDYAFLFEIGNPFYRNHFHRTWNNPKYHKIFIDIERGIKEGRHDESFREEMMNEANYSILYDCKFPKENATDDEGWTPLLTESELKNALTDKITHYGNFKLGQDVAGGGRDYSVLVKRSEGAAEILDKNHSADTMSLVGKLLEVRDEIAQDNRLEGIRVISPRVEVDIDKTGIGQGTFDRTREQRSNVIGVVLGGKPEDDVKFYNKRAEVFWRAREWILGGGKLLKHNDWYQLLNVKYKYQSDKKIQIISKELLRKQGIKSPDVADALALTFNNRDIPQVKIDLMPTQPKNEGYKMSPL